MEHSVTYLPLNPSQERMRFLDALNPKRTDLNISCVVELKQRMTTRQLHAALESIRPSFLFLNVRLSKSEGIPAWRFDQGTRVQDQAVLPEITCQTQDELTAHYAAFSTGASELTKRRPWRVQLVQCDDHSFLMCSFHHAICDGDRSLLLFLDALAGELETGESMTGDHDAADADDEDWSAVERFADALTNPADLRSLFAAGNPGDAVSSEIVVDEDQRSWPAHLAQAALLAGLQAATSNLVRDEQIVVGVPADGVASQSREFGYFGNPGLALVQPVTATGTSIEMPPKWALAQCRQADSIGEIPYQAMIASRHFDNIPNPEKLFDILLVERKLFTFENRLVARAFEPVPSQTPYLLTVNYWFDAQNGLVVRVETTSGLVTQAMMDDIAKSLLESLSGAPISPKAEAVAAGSHAMPTAGVSCHVERVIEHAGSQPDAPALVSVSGDPVSYGHLADRATGLSEQLCEMLGDGPATVAFSGERHPDEIIALLGTNLAGACFMRLDEADTAQHIAQLEAAKVDAVILSEAMSEADLTVAETFLAANGFASGITCSGFRVYRVSQLSGAGTVGDAYVVMTSGTTGRPKAIRFPARQLERLVDWHIEHLPEAQRVLQLSSLMHDVAYHEIYATLAAGRVLAFAGQGLKQSPSDLAAFVDETGLNRIYLPTVLLDGVARAALAKGLACNALRMVIVAGGPLTITQPIRDWFKSTGAILSNHYGMSETQDISAHVLSGDPETWAERPHAGQAIAGTTVSILGSRNHPLPNGVIGNLAVRFADMAPEAGNMVLGDIGYRSDDGNFHILGRSDRVVKVRGYRLSLEAIEASLGEAEGIEEVAAIPAPENAVRQDPWVFVSGSASQFDQVEQDGLNDMLVDRHGTQARCRLVPIDRLPRLKNEKTDYQTLGRWALEMAETAKTQGEGTKAPTVDTDEHDPISEAINKLVPGAEWSNVSRFSDIGFDSLGVMALELELSPHFPNVTVADFFNHPTVGALRRHLCGAKPTQSPVADPARRDVAQNTVSVVGMAGRFPGAESVDTLWQNLVSQQCLIDPAETPDPASSSSFFVPSFGRLGEVDSFDHTFFGLSPAEAYRMDPQMRLFLELCWEALENSGDAAYEENARIGIFAGAGMSTYLLNELEPARLAKSNSVFREDNTLQQRLGNDRNYLTSAASYRFGFTGPSVTIQAACATSLVAVHYARQALLNNECDVALAGGLSVIWPEPEGYDFVEGSVRSPNGRCRPFDASADGTVFGNGGGMVVLKRAADAKNYKNHVYAEILGSAVNHDGGRKMNFAAPSANGQSDVVRGALDDAGLSASDLDFIEAHGTGTVIGDAIEWSSIGDSLKDRRSDRPCLVGSVKSNIGHLDEGAGIAGFIKTCLSVSERCYPGTCHFEDLNSSLCPSENIRVSAENTVFPDGVPVTGGVSAFGMGGTNAHAIVRSAT